MCNAATFNLVFYAMMINFLYVQVEILAQSEGREAKGATRRCLARTITPPTAKQINWTGLGMLGKRLSES